MKPSTRTFRYHLLAVMAAALVSSTAVDQAHACGGGWWPEANIDYRLQGIVRAEKSLQDGKYEAAAGAVLRMIPHIDNYRALTKDKIINRALRVLAVASTRGNGNLDLRRELSQHQRNQRKGNVPDAGQARMKWAVATLQNLNGAKKKDMVLESELAEAMAKTDGHRSAGQKKLESLAKRDLLASPEAYQLLASLRAEAGDNDGRVAALQRCRAMAKEASVCGGTATKRG